MFTGIVETTGKVVSLKKEKSNLLISIEASFAYELLIGQSISHNGVCLTVESIDKQQNRYFVTAVKETLLKTNFSDLKNNSVVNLERSLKAGDRIDGHFVQGHVDVTAKARSIKKEKGSWLFEFSIQQDKKNVQYNNLIVEKGSICINGVSLTVVSTDSIKNELVFSVAIIPHTYKHTNFSTFHIGSRVNIEFDVLGKYIQKIVSNQSHN